MATGRVRVGFFHIRTRSIGLLSKPELDPINKRVFYAGPRPALSGPTGPAGPTQPMPLQSEKKKKKPEALNLHKRTQQIRNPKNKPQDAKIMFTDLDQKPKNKNPKIMFINLDQKPKNKKSKTLRSCSSIGLEQPPKPQTQTQKFQIFYFPFQNHKHNHKS